MNICLVSCCFSPTRSPVSGKKKSTLLLTEVMNGRDTSASNYDICRMTVGDRVEFRMLPCEHIAVLFTLLLFGSEHVEY